MLLSIWWWLRTDDVGRHLPLKQICVKPRIGNPNTTEGFACVIKKEGKITCFAYTCGWFFIQDGCEWFPVFVCMKVYVIRTDLYDTIQKNTY